MYGVIHFAILTAQYFSETFKQRLQNFKNDQMTIKHHYLEDFKVWYYLIFAVKLITFIFYLYFFFFLDKANIHDWGQLFYGITYTYIISVLIDLGITIYIILYKNNPVIEVIGNFCYHCATKAGFALGALHVSSNVMLISPNIVSNSYHKYSPLGRGYSAWGAGQLYQVDWLASNLGEKFDYKQVIDSNKMLNPQKLTQYSKHHNLDMNAFKAVGLSKKF